MNTETNTSTETEVDISLIKLITTYCVAEIKAQSKYFPLVEKAISMFEEDHLDQTEINRQFRVAFAKAIGLEEGAYTKDTEYAHFRGVALKIVNIAKEGRPWYDKRREAKVGFYKMYEMSKDVTGEDNEPSTAKAKAKPKAKAKSNPKVEPSDETEEEETEPIADKEWFGKCKLIVKGEPDAFVKMISGLIDKGLLPDTILEPIKAHLSGE